MYETIVFDLDGTLLDTLDDLADSTNVALAAYGLPPRTREEVRGFVGNGVAKLIERAVGKEHLAEKENVLAAFRERYAAHCADKTAPYEGVISLLQTLRERGIKTAVLSNKPDAVVKSLSTRYFGGLLQESVGENEAAGIRKKPAPDALYEVMKNLSADPETTVYVGDSDVDIQTAKNAGIDCICVTWGFRDRDFLEKNGGVYFVDAPAEILKYMDKR